MRQGHVTDVAVTETRTNWYRFADVSDQPSAYIFRIGSCRHWAVPATYMQICLNISVFKTLKIF